MLKSTLLLLLGASFASAAAIPGVVSFSSNLVWPTPTPTSIALNAVESNVQAIGIVEKVNLTLSSAVPVDLVVNPPATYNSILDPILNSGSIAAGTAGINSYFLHYDPTLLPFALVRTPGSVDITFTNNSRILGIQVLASTFDSPANAQLLYSGLTYGSNGLRGMELGILGDAIQVFDERTIRINMNTTVLTLDQVRILVQTPEPGTILMFAPALGLLAWKLRRRRVS